jgi:acyl-CoA synthetase (AMP-forming)/AMP-acid ligase II
MLMNEESFRQLDFSAMKACFSGSAPFSVEGMNAVEEVVGKGKVTEGLAMTECSPVFTANPVKGRKKVGSVGVPVPSTLVKIMPPEGGDREMPLGEPGEVIVHGPQVMKGYHNRPAETANALREHDGKIWMHTGDVGYMDEEGYIWVVDRLKDMVVVGGFKVFSTEVEGKFYQHPAILLCAVIGVPNPERPGSELVKLVVQKSEAYTGRSDDEVREELTAFAREKLAPYKVPKVIEIVEAMPLTAVGKVDKKALRV